MHTLTTSVQHSIECPNHSNQTRKGNERYPGWKGKVKLLSYLYVYDITLYVENAKDIIQKLLKLINEFSKAAE